MPFSRQFLPRNLLILARVCLGMLAALEPANSASPKQADKIVIEKSKRTMTLWHGSEIPKTCKVALGGRPVGAKDRQGDHKPPEVLYWVARKNPASIFHRALHLSYPSAADRLRAA